MSTRHTPSATRPSRRKVHSSRIHWSDPGWERNFQLPAVLLRDLAVSAGKRIVQRRRLALGLNVLNLLLLSTIYYAIVQAGAQAEQTTPLAIIIFAPLWCAALYLQMREAFDQVRVSGVLQWINLLLLVVAPIAVCICVLRV